MSTELALSDQMKKAEIMAGSSLLPESYRKQPANLLWAMELAQALDVSLAQAITGITVIQGKPTMSAEMMRALVLRAGHRFRVSDMTDKAVTVEVARREWPDDVQAFTFSMADAQHAGLAKSATYQKHPKAMLLARATSMACRAVFPDVVSGMGYTPDEISQPSHRVTVDTSRLTPQTVSKEAKTRREWTETDAEHDELEHELDAQTPESVPIDVETGEILDAEVLETEPETAPDDGPPTLTSEQSSRIVAALKALKLNKVDALALYSEVCGRAVPATWELTRVEAGLVLAQLETMTADG